MDYRFLYMATYVGLIVSFLFETIVIIARTNTDIATLRENRFFHHMGIAFCMYLWTEIFVAMTVTGYVKPDTIFAEVMVSIGMFMLSVTGFYWLWFVETVITPKVSESLVLRAISFVPVLVLSFLLFYNHNNDLLFTITPNGEIVMQDFYFLITLFIEIYLLIPPVHAIMMWLKYRKSSKRHVFRRIVTFMTFPFIAGLIEMSIQGTPVTSIGAMTAIFYIFISMQADRIYSDLLTGIANRRKMVEEYNIVLSGLDEGDGLLLGMMDVDQFKAINDTYGHHIGDEALKVVANGLKELEKNDHLHIARWGGDEFVFFVRYARINEPAFLEKKIKDAIDVAAMSHQCAYRICVSIGITTIMQKDTDIFTALKLADKKMYQQKQAHRKQTP